MLELGVGLSSILFLKSVVCAMLMQPFAEYRSLHHPESERLLGFSECFDGLSKHKACY